jgi:hypothetical protein
VAADRKDPRGLAAAGAEGLEADALAGGGEWEAPGSWGAAGRRGEAVAEAEAGWGAAAAEAEGPVGGEGPGDVDLGLLQHAAACGAEQRPLWRQALLAEEDPGLALGAAPEGGRAGARLLRAMLTSAAAAGGGRAAEPDPLGHLLAAVQARRLHGQPSQRPPAGAGPYDALAWQQTRARLLQLLHGRPCARAADVAALLGGGEEGGHPSGPFGDAGLDSARLSQAWAEDPLSGSPRGSAVPAALGEAALASRVCLKLFGLAPQQLPPDLLARLRRWCAAAEDDVLQVGRSADVRAYMCTFGGSASGALGVCALGMGASSWPLSPQATCASPAGVPAPRLRAHHCLGAAQQAELHRRGEGRGAGQRLPGQGGDGAGGRFQGQLPAERGSRGRAGWTGSR